MLYCRKYRNLAPSFFYGCRRNLSRQRNPKYWAQNRSISSPPLSLQSSSSIPQTASSQSHAYLSQSPPAPLQQIASTISCSPTMRRLTFLRASLTAGSIVPGTESSLSSSAIRDSFILSLSRSLLRRESTVSCIWIRRWRRPASELTADIVL